MQLVPPRPSLAEQTAQILREAIDGGMWTGQLPGERELSRQLNVSRPTLSLALDQLTREGWLKKTPGRARVIIQGRKVRATAKSAVIGLLTPVPLREVPPFALCWMDRLRELLAAAGLQLEIHHGRRWYSRRPEEDLSALIQQVPAAAWILFVATERMQRWAADCGLSGVLAGTCYPGIQLSSVDFDYRAVCRHAAGQFLARGHQQIVLLMQSSGMAGDRESEAGFREAFQNRTGEATPLVSLHDGTPEAISRQLDLLLARKPAPTAFLVARSMPALMIASELARRGTRVPQDAAIIARDSDHFFEYFSPDLARYQADPEVHARRLARLVLQLARGTTSRLQTIRIMPKFHPGSSLGPRK